MAKITRSEVYSRHIARLDRSLEAMDRLDSLFTRIRLLTFLAGGLASVIAFILGGDWIGWSTVLLSICAFAVVVAFHRRLSLNMARFRASRRLASAQLARLRLDWDRIPLPPPSQPVLGHPFAMDLNISGSRSVHHLLDVSQSTGGSQHLLSWLLGPIPDPQAIRRRHELVRALQPLHGFRWRLGLNSALVTAEGERWDGEQLLVWLESHSASRSLKPYLLFLAILSLINIVLFVLNLLSLAPAFWIVSLLLYSGVYLWLAQEMRALFEQAEHLRETLGRFRAVLIFLEGYPFPPGSPLAGLCEPFLHASQRPSRVLKRISRLATAASMQKNQFFWLLFNALVPWDLYFTYRLNQYKRELYTLLPGWLDTWYELEAFNSIANFAYLNPGYVYPEILDSRVGPVFEVRAIGHPLLPPDEKVCNDFSLRSLGEIAVVTGSNMSGKSTFLRTLGANLCLAYAGAPVDAESFQALPFRLFTCIQLSDSLRDGISYFYAEVRRLKALLLELRADQPLPLFFLIDEIFRGTNNLERQIGAQAFVSALVGERGVGVISTHDLELTRLEDELAGVHNYHFREEVQDGRMTFDFHLRPGPSPTTNALKIMALEGLPVDKETLAK